MTDKLTDNEIVKGLEICSNNGDCKECPINPHHGNYGYCTSLAIKATLDLINRQKAEIEQWKEEANRYQTLWCEDVQIARAEAIKEFAEKSEKDIFIKQEDERMQMLKILKTYRGTKSYSDTERATDNWLRGYGEAVQDVLGVFDNLLKEMLGENNETKTF